MQQAARVSQRVACFHLGSLVEVDDTNKILPTHRISSPRITLPADSANQVAQIDPAFVNIAR
jgi:hypothetical protein